MKQGQGDTKLQKKKKNCFLFLDIFSMLFMILFYQIQV